jgi:murein DD-endopeptidase MepM/ murein hydrolase activator NlpD
LVPLDVDGAAGPRPLVVDGQRADGGSFHVEEPLAVDLGGYDERAITVAKKFTAPSRAQQRRARAESRELARVLTTRSSQRLWRGSFARPTQTEETSPFGTLRTYNGARRSRHLGLDLDGVVGDPIAAAQSGKVVLAKDRFYSGGTVVVDHGEGLFTMYFHMSKVLVHVGQKVEKGELLGRVGSTGQVTGPHLHFSVKADGLYVDPARVLSLDLSADPLDTPHGEPIRLAKPVKTKEEPKTEEGSKAGDAGE